MFSFDNQFADKTFIFCCWVACFYYQLLPWQCNLMILMFIHLRMLTFLCIYYTILICDTWSSSKSTLHCLRLLAIREKEENFSESKCTEAQYDVKKTIGKCLAILWMDLFIIYQCTARICHQTIWHIPIIGTHVYLSYSGTQLYLVSVLSLPPDNFQSTCVDILAMTMFVKVELNIVWGRATITIITNN